MTLGAALQRGGRARIYGRSNTQIRAVSRPAGDNGQQANDQTASGAILFRRWRHSLRQPKDKRGADNQVPAMIKRCYVLNRALQVGGGIKAIATVLQAEVTFEHILPTASRLSPDLRMN